MVGGAGVWWEGQECNGRGKCVLGEAGVWWKGQGCGLRKAFHSQRGFLFFSLALCSPEVTRRAEDMESGLHTERWCAQRGVFVGARRVLAGGALSQCPQACVRVPPSWGMVYNQGIDWPERITMLQVVYFSGLSFIFIFFCLC